LEVVNHLKEKILVILESEEPNLVDFIAVFKAAYDNGISFLEFEELYHKLTSILVIIAKMHYLLNTSDEINAKLSEFYFTNLEA
jgi:hypothetical protein